ncbi:hypothetical protein [Absidia glauca]|uniref:Uncharacterized protein n=1 Tax=Absidia glauca TaxID=4829 RepID=A0A168NH42_ABSGL|nr:hypothetical protein [Absidia glauca]
MALPSIYGKVFGLGLFTGACMEVLLIKSNYYGMLLASEAKAKLKELQQEQEDFERFQRLQQLQQQEVETDKS